MANCVRIEWASEPKITPCAVGEPADFRGLKFIAFYDDGTEQEIDVVLRMFHERNLQEVGTERIGQVIYEKKRLTAKIPLKNTTLISIQATPTPQLKCIEGEPLDRSQVIVTAFYNDGSSRTIDNYKIAPHLGLSMSDEKITFRYGRCTSEMPITVYPKQTQQQPQQNPVPAGNIPNHALDVSSETQAPLTQPPSSAAPTPPPTKTVVAISVARKPNRQKYLVGDTLVDLKGGRLDVIYSDGTVGQIDMISDGTVYIDSKKPGMGTISFSCLGKPVSIPIDVLEPQIVKMSIVKQPAKMDYEVGEELNLAGLVLEVIYNDGSVRMVRGLQSNGFIVERGHEDEGVTLSYEGKPFTLRINVKKKEVPITALSVELAHEPDKIRYLENDPHGLDLTGAELVAQMSDGRRLMVPVTTDMVDPVDLSQPGRKVLNIRYMGHTAVCSIFVDAKTLQKLILSSPIKKTEYIEGEPVDLRGLAVEACYDNGVKVPVENFAVTPDRVSVGDKEVKISCDGVWLSIPIIVHPMEVTLIDWARQPLKTAYYTHESSFICDGGVLHIKWNNGSEEELPLKPEMVSGFRTDRIGPQLLTITYKNKTVPFSIMVKERVLLGLRVVKAPHTEYIEGEVFDPLGLIVEALYTGETSEVVSVNHLPYGPLSQDDTSIMLVYQDKAAVLPISVSPRLEPAALSKTTSASELAPAPKPVPLQTQPNEEISSGRIGKILEINRLNPSQYRKRKVPHNHLA